MAYQYSTLYLAPVFDVHVAYCGLARVKSLGVSLGPLYPNEDTGVRDVNPLLSTASKVQHSERERRARSRSPLPSVAAPEMMSSWGYQRGPELKEQKTGQTTKTIEETEPDNVSLAPRGVRVEELMPAVDYTRQYNFYAVTVEQSFTISATVGDGLDPKLVSLCTCNWHV